VFAGGEAGGGAALNPMPEFKVLGQRVCASKEMHGEKRGRPVWFCRQECPQAFFIFLLLLFILLISKCFLLHSKTLSYGVLSFMRKDETKVI